VYDIAVFMACHLADKWLARLYDFKRHGLLNRRDVRIKLYLLHGKTEVPDDLKPENWPYEVVFVPSGHTHDGPKVYNFAANLSAAEVDSARWWLKIDDDSVTDVHTLLTKLETEYDATHPLYIFGAYGGSCEQLFLDAVSQTKYGPRILLPNIADKQAFHHEQESCVISAPCLKMIVNDNECKKLLSFLAQHDVKHCWADQGLALAARCVRVHGDDCLFMTWFPLVSNCSLFGGRFAHIHNVHSASPSWPLFMTLLNDYKITVD